MRFASRVLRLSRTASTPLHSSTTTLPSRLPATTRFGTSDYGSPTGGPISENPKEQGPNPSADKEHPGPPPPKAGQDTGAGGTKAGAKGHNTPNSQTDVRPSVGNEPTQGKNKKQHFSTSAVARADKPTPSNGAKPKILDETPPTDAEASEEVKQHNREMEQRADKAVEGPGSSDAKNEKVDKSFWKGKAGENKDGKQ